MLCDLNIYLKLFLNSTYKTTLHFGYILVFWLNFFAEAQLLIHRLVTSWDFF